MEFRRVLFRSVALGSDGPREGAARVLPGSQALDGPGEVVSRPPTQLLARPGVHVDAVDGREHAPAASGVDTLVLRHEAPHPGRRVASQGRQVAAPERGGGADQLAAQAEATKTGVYGKSVSGPGDL